MQGSVPLLGHDVNMYVKFYKWRLFKRIFINTNYISGIVAGIQLPITTPRRGYKYMTVNVYTIQISSHILQSMRQIFSPTKHSNIERWLGE